jgi:hypothetical protein
MLALGLVNLIPPEAAALVSGGFSSFSRRDLRVDEIRLDDSHAK